MAKDPTDPLTALERENHTLRQRVAQLERHLRRFESGEAQRLGHGLSEREALLMEAERIAHMGSWVWDVRSDEVIWSDELHRILGYDPDVDAATTDAFFARVHPDDRERVRTASQRGIESGVSQQVDFRVLRPDGTVRYASMDGALLFDGDGKLVRAVGTVLDVTEAREGADERTRLETKLREAHKLEAVGLLAGGIAHDFNNLLTVILANLELVDPANRSAAVSEIEQAALSAAKLTKQLLAYSRRAILKPQVCNLVDATRGALNLVKRTIGEDIDVTLDTPGDAWLVRVDPAQIEQMLLNLALNARDAMPNGGSITFTIENVHAHEDEEHPGNWVVLQARDTGTGMDPETLSKVFEPFFTTKAPGEGTGLGLAMVFGAMKQAGGFVEATSAPGEGATFRLYFPRHVGAATSSVESDEAPPSGSARLLLVEDDPAVARVLASLLEAAGYELSMVSEPARALELARARAHDLLVTDIVMPEMTGTELVDRLREDAPDLRVLFITGYAKGAEAIRPEPGRTSLLVKPFQKSELLRAVSELLASHDRSNSD